MAPFFFVLTLVASGKGPCTASYDLPATSHQLQSQALFHHANDA
jgi:hypothetical protein